MKMDFKRILPALVLLATATAWGASPSNSFFDKNIKFAWGADLGASIDMGGQDMSALDFSASFGMRRGWINFLGVGAGASIMVSNSCRSFPLYASFRTNFVDRPSLLFWDLRLGVSLNYLEHNHQQTGLYGSTGLGINLARSKSFNSHIIIGYTYRERRPITGAEQSHSFPDLHYASMTIGVVF